MPCVSKHKNRAAFFEETTAGTGPADWDASGNLIHLAAPFDVSGLAQVVAEDTRTVTRLTETAAGQVFGRKSGSQATVSAFLSGKDEVTSDTAQVAESNLMKLLEHAFGGMSRSYATDIAAGSHSTTGFDVTSATGMAEGQLIGIIDADDTNSLVEWAQIDTISGTSITVSRALSFTPAENDKVVGTATAYPDPDILECSSDNSGTTLSWYLERGDDGDHLVEILGSKAMPSFDGLARDGMPVLNLAINAGKFTTAESLTKTTFTGSPTGGAPVMLGPRTKLWLQDVGTTTATASIHLVSMSLNPGVAVAEIPAVTSQTDNLEGFAGYSTAMIAPTLEITITGDKTLFTDFGSEDTTRTFKHLMLERRGPEGKSLCIYLPKCEITQVPNAFAENGEIVSYALTLRGHERTPSATGTSLNRSPLLIGLG